MAVQRNLERERYWRGVIRQQRGSGLGISAFCREHEVPVSSFFLPFRGSAFHFPRISFPADRSGALRLTT